MKFINFTINNIEPMKLTKAIKTKDYQLCKSYISGNNLKGAFISNYLSLKSCDLTKEEDKRLLLKGGLKFLNAYPIKNKDCITVPSLNIDENDDDISFIEIDINTKTYQNIDVEKFSNVHLKKSKSNEVYRYEALREGYEFSGCIICNDDTKTKLVCEILKEGKFYIGGSKSSGYGKCEVKDIKIVDTCIENTISKKNISKAKITILAMSDIILRDEKGFYLSEIPSNLLGEKLNVKASLECKNANVKMQTGYNAKWGCNTPSVLSIKAGSKFTYNITGKFENKDLDNFIENGIGERRSEGFGRIYIFDCDNLKEKINTSVSSNQKSVVKNLDKNSKKEMKILIDRIYKSRLDNSIEKRVLDFNRSIISPQKMKNQLTQLYDLMILLEGYSYEHGIKILDDYFENKNSKNLNSTTKNNLKKISINNQSIEEILKYELKNKDINQFYKEYEKPITIADVTSSITLDEIYRYKVKLFKEQFRFYTRISS